MSDQAAVERARKVIEVAREFQVTDQPVPESGDEAIAVAEKLIGMAVNARSQNSKHAVIAPLLEAAGISEDGTPAAAPEPAPAAPAPEPAPVAPAPAAQDDLSSMFADPAPAPVGPVLGELVGLQPGEVGLTEEIVDKFLEKAKALEISSDDLIFIAAVEFGRRTLSDLTADMAKKLFNRILEEGQARLDGKGTFAPEPTVTHGSFEGEKIPVQSTTSTGSATTTSTMSLPLAVPVTQVPDAEPEAPKGGKAEPFKAKYAPNEVLGPAFKAARERVNLTIEQAAEITKLKTAALAAYEDGAMRPQGKTIGLLADAYDCDADELGQGRVSPTGEAAPASQAAVAEVAPDPVGPRDTPPWAEPDTPDPVAEAAPVEQAHARHSLTVPEGRPRGHRWIKSQETCQIAKNSITY